MKNIHDIKNELQKNLDDLNEMIKAYPSLEQMFFADTNDLNEEEEELLKVGLDRKGDL